MQAEMMEQTIPVPAA
jgi:hypothetical protein